MNFLVLLMAVVVAEVFGPPVAIQRDYWFVRWQAWLAGRPALVALPGLSNAVLLLVPVLLLALVLQVFGGWLFGLVGFVINLLVLLYAFGRGDVDHSIALFQDGLARGDVQGAWHEAAALDVDHSADQAESWPELHDRALAAVSYHYFERYFPVVLWFVMLGAPGALFYRLVSLAAANDNVGGKTTLRQLLWVLEWIPLRLLGLALALVGNFSATIRVWRASLFAVDDSTPEVLAGLVRGALLVESPPSPGESVREIDAVAALFRRALILAVGLIALLELL